jgi:hypothetical protein
MGRVLGSIRPENSARKREKAGRGAGRAVGLSVIVGFTWCSLGILVAVALAVGLILRLGDDILALAGDGPTTVPARSGQGPA